MLASDEIVSTSSSASWSPIAARTSAMRLVTPVEVSLWTTITARVSASSASAIRSGSAPWRQSPSSQVDVEPELLGHRAPQRREVPGLGRDHLVAGRERVDDRRLPRAGAGGRIDDHRAARCGRPRACRRAPRARASRSPGRGGRSSARRSPAAPGRARSWGRESAGSGDRCDTSDVSHGSERETCSVMGELAAALERELAGRGARGRLYAPPVRGRRQPVRGRAARGRLPARRRRRRRGGERSPRGSACRSSRAAAGRASRARPPAARGLVLDTSRHMNAIDADRRGRARAGRARRRAGGPQPRGQALRARLRARHLDVEPGDARRDDRQQLLGQRVDRPRHDDRPRARARGGAAPTARAPRSRATRRPTSAFERRLHAGVERILREHARAIAEDYPKHWRQSGGYRLDRMDPFDLSKLVVGSEGTLAIVTAATVGLVELPKAKMFAVGHFDDAAGRDRRHRRRARARAVARSR